MNIFGLGLPELIVIALVLLLFFGPKRLPGLFRSLGSSISEFKRGVNDITAFDSPTHPPTSDTTAKPSETDNSPIQTKSK